MLPIFRNWISKSRQEYSSIHFNLLLKHFQIRLQDGSYKYISIDDTKLDLEHLPMWSSISDNLFTYEKIAKNAIKFIYNGTQRSMTGLNFILKNRDDEYQTLFKVIIAGKKEYSKKI